MIGQRSRLALFSLALCACASVSCGSTETTAVPPLPASPPLSSVGAPASTTAPVPTTAPASDAESVSSGSDVVDSSGSDVVDAEPESGGGVAATPAPAGPAPGADQPGTESPPAGGGPAPAPIPQSEWCLDPESAAVLDALAGLGTDSQGLRFVAGWWDHTTVAAGCPSLNWVLARGDDQDMRAPDNFYLFFDAQGTYLGPATPEFHTNSHLTASTDDSATILFQSAESLPDHSAPAHVSTVTYTLDNGVIVVDGQLPAADWG
ncbi:hypothetical protein GCM10007304_33950 [Rhodococcoides trifolii]|uniref:LppP/LprE family lipoprotein n=1 Tax=Rhodococcoides trifolii TaxID=908250 RepID=A0A917G0X5_9NOCA|nr:LppP/LprE family lipoprotein [Rhodococcus trifolii]GGG16983.1 hypothetical protein GCM10007304_33950 [Rhodococcus trifolii]